jgi:hypothetical protein
MFPPFSLLYIHGGFLPERSPSRSCFSGHTHLLLFLTRAEGGRRYPSHPAAPDYSVQLNYLELLLDLPWSEFTKDNFDLKRAQRILDKDHFGLEKVKQRIVEYLAVLKDSRKWRGGGSQLDFGNSFLCVFFYSSSVSKTLRLP